MIAQKVANSFARERLAMPLLIVVITFLVSANNALAQVVVCANANFGGVCRTFDEGIYDLGSPSLLTPCMRPGRRPIDPPRPGLCGWKEVISSIRVVSGTRAVLEKQPIRAGTQPERWYFFQDTPYVGNEANDKASSLRVEKMVWGIADLHTHPASHLAFSPDESAGKRIMWGKPGLSIRNAHETIESDLASCNGEEHSWDDGDPVRREQRRGIIKQFTSVQLNSHHTKGAGSYEDWPSAFDVFHQQMHIMSIYRAYQGGLRLMFADAVDNNMIGTLWNWGINISPGNCDRPRPTRNGDFDYQSARNQLTFIKRMVEANCPNPDNPPDPSNPSSGCWMQIAKNPQDARAIIGKGKLAIVLGVEMDNLSIEDILNLQREFQIAHVIPVHLADNDFGGTAVYNDAFNTVNHFLNRSFLEVDFSEIFSFRLGRPQVLLGGDGNSYQPKPIGNDSYCSLHYATCTSGIPPEPNVSENDTDLLHRGKGHQNKHGVVSPDYIEKLMQAGLMVDIAHMSYKSALNTLEIAEKYNYPIMFGHGGIGDVTRDQQQRIITRPANERTLIKHLATRLAQSEGVVGIGTAGDPGIRIEKNSSSPINVAIELERLNTQINSILPSERRAALPNLFVTGVRIAIQSGVDRWTGSTQPGACVTLRGRSDPVCRPFRLHDDLDIDEGVDTFIDLPERTSLNDIQEVTTRGCLNPLSLAGSPAVCSGAWAVKRVQYDFRVKLERPLDNPLNLPTPIRSWASGLNSTLQVMKGRGVAIGTDFNGFESQVAYSEFPDPDVNAALDGITEDGFKPLFRERLAEPFLGYRDPTTGASRGRTYSFRKQGLAHYGMLPEFISTLYQNTDQNSVKALFRSADDVIHYWEKSLQQSNSVTPGTFATNERVLQLKVTILTGKDDLRGGTSNVHLVMKFRTDGGELIEKDWQMNEGRQLPCWEHYSNQYNFTSRTGQPLLGNFVSLEYYGTMDEGSLGFGKDHWDLVMLRVDFLNFDGRIVKRRTVRGRPVIRMEPEARYRRFDIPLNPPS
jgi:microsomal dipeptidase-like Zn-dependent dipeptidase